MGKGDGSGSGLGMGSDLQNGKFERFWIPSFPLPIAIICCVLNFLIPGFGTLISGFGSLCCARTEDMKNRSKALSCCVNIGISFLQLLAAFCCIVGICWSWYWGIAFLITSIEYYNKNKVNDIENVSTHPVASTTVIVQQPSFVPFKGEDSVTHPNVKTHQPVAAPLYPPGQGASSVNQQGPGTSSTNQTGSGTSPTNQTGSGTRRTNQTGAGTSPTNQTRSGTSPTNQAGSGTSPTNQTGSGTSPINQGGPLGMELYPPTIKNADGSEQKVQY